MRVRYGDELEYVQITGDFLLYPEEKLGEIEKALLGSSITESEGGLAAKVSEVVAANGIELVGITPEAIASTVKMAVVQRNGA